MSVYVYLKVQDANADKYTLEFEAEHTSDGLVLLCPLCGESLNFEAETVACANGHIAYTIIDEKIVEKVNDAFR